MIKFQNVPLLSEKLNVSHMTIRRDIKELLLNNSVKTLHGSIILNSENDIESDEKLYSIDRAESLNIEEKEKIGKLAALCIEPDDTLIIDYGSTAEYITKYIPDDIPLTVLTYSLNVINDIVKRENCKLIFTGGVFHKSTLSFDSPEGIEMIRNFRAHKAFITAAGIDNKFGATCSNYYEKAYKKRTSQIIYKKNSIG